MAVMVNVMERPGDVKRAAMRVLGDQIAEDAAHLDAAMHRLLTRIREFDTGNGWFHAGAQSCAHWLSWRVGWTLGTGREHVRVARRLAELPRVDEALREGKLSYAKVRAITRVASSATEAQLVINALASTAAQLETICRKFRAVQRLSRKEQREVDEERHVRRRDLDNGMVRIEATLRPEEAAVVFAAIEQQAKALAAARPAEAPTPAEAAETAAANVSAETRQEDRPAQVRAKAPRRRFDRADALVAVAQALLRGEKPNRSPIEVVMTVPRAALAKHENGCVAADSVENVGVFADGTCVSAETAQRLTCDCGVVELVEDESGQPLSVGRKRRTMSSALWRALLRRDTACRFPGCTNHVYLEGHHVKHWAHGGETSLENACLLCTRHHTFVHELGYRIEMVDGEPRFFDPRGRVVTQEGPRIAPSWAAAWERIRAENEELGITANTNQCRWNGLPVQYDLVVGGLGRLDGLRGPANRALPPPLNS